MEVIKMAWQNPKTNWKAGDTPTSGDFNRIEGNIDILGRLDRTSAYGVATGTNNYAVTLNPNPLTYYEGMCIAVKIPNQNTGPSTLNVNGLGAKPIRKQNGSAVSSGNLKAGIIYTMRYDGINFILQGEGGEGTAQPDDVVKGKTFTNDGGTFTGSLELTGDARRLDVVEGRTYYKDNPKEKISGLLPDMGIANVKPAIWEDKRLPMGKYSSVRVEKLENNLRQFDYGNRNFTLSSTGGTSGESLLLTTYNGNGEVVYAGCQVQFTDPYGVEWEIPLVYFIRGWSNASRSFSWTLGESAPYFDKIYLNLNYSNDTKNLSLSYMVYGNPEWRNQNVLLKWEIVGVPE